MLRPVGMNSSVSWVSTAVFSACWMSTTGDSPETVIVSSTAPTDISTSTVKATSPARTTSFLIWVPKPARVKVSV